MKQIERWIKRRKQENKKNQHNQQMTTWKTYNKNSHQETRQRIHPRFPSLFCKKKKKKENNTFSSTSRFIFVAPIYCYWFINLLKIIIITLSCSRKQKIRSICEKTNKFIHSYFLLERKKPKKKKLKQNVWLSFFFSDCITTIYIFSPFFRSIELSKSILSPWLIN